MDEREDELDPIISLGIILGVPLSKVEAVREALATLPDVRLIVSRVGAPRTLWLIRKEEGRP